MREVISMEDRSRMFHRCVVEYAGIPVFVQSINGDESITIKCLETQECQDVIFDIDLLRAPRNRLGYVNLPNVAAYAMRMAVRRMKVGLSTENFRVPQDRFNKRMDQRGEIAALLRNIDCKELFDTLRGNYPSFQEAIGMLNAQRNLIAFDRQFAISSSLTVYYRGEEVGAIGKNQIKTVDGITWKKPYQHLKDVVGVSLSLSR